MSHKKYKNTAARGAEFDDDVNLKNNAEYSGDADVNNNNTVNTETHEKSAEIAGNGDKNKAETQLRENGGSCENTYFFCGLSGVILEITALALIFVPALGVYSLIAAVLFGIAALAFLSAQKKRQSTKRVATWVNILNVATYAVLAICIAVFVGGMIYNGTR